CFRPGSGWCSPAASTWKSTAPPTPCACCGWAPKAAPRAWASCSCSEPPAQLDQHLLGVSQVADVAEQAAQATVIPVAVAVVGRLQRLGLSAAAVDHVQLALRTELIAVAQLQAEAVDGERRHLVVAF